MIVNHIEVRRGYHVVTVDSVDAGVRGVCEPDSRNREERRRRRPQLMSLGGVWTIHSYDEKTRTIVISGGEGIEVGERLEWLG